MISSNWVAKRVFKRYYGPDKELNIVLLTKQLEEHAQTYETIVDSHDFFRDVYRSLGGDRYVEREFGYRITFDIFDTSRQWAGFSTIAALIIMFFYTFIGLFIELMNAFLFSAYKSDLLLFGHYYDGETLYIIWRLGRILLVIFVSFILYAYHHRISLIARTIASIFTGFFTLFFSPFLILYAFLQLPRKVDRKLILTIIFTILIATGLNLGISTYLKNNIIRFNSSDFVEEGYEFNHRAVFIIPLADYSLNHGISWVTPENLLEVRMYYIEPEITLVKPLVVIPDDLYDFDEGSYITYNIFVNEIQVCDEDITYTFNEGVIIPRNTYTYTGCKRTFDEHRVTLDELDYHSFHISIRLTYTVDNVTQTSELLLMDIPDSLMYASDNYFQGYDLFYETPGEYTNMVEYLNINTYGDSIGKLELGYVIPALDNLTLPIKENTDITFTYQVGEVRLDDDAITTTYTIEDYSWKNFGSIVYFFPSSNAPTINAYMDSVSIYVWVDYTNTSGESVTEKLLIGTILDFHQYEFQRR